MAWDSQKLFPFIYSTCGLIATLLALVLARTFDLNDLSLIGWLIFVLGVDVSHVYSTLYRTYFNRSQRAKLEFRLWLIPLLCFFSAFGLAYTNLGLFWSVLAYIAIFHFSRQQIGFLRWLSKPEFSAGLLPFTPYWQTKIKIFFEMALYLSTFGSVLLWHLQGPKNFNWFIKMDLFYLDQIAFTQNELVTMIISILIIGFNFFAFTGGLFLALKKKINYYTPLLLLSTFSSWYFPIVVFNSDFIFTMANVLAHGVPYLILVYSEETRTKSIFRSAELFIPLLLLFAFCEEALWDGLIWREHADIFESFYFLPHLTTPSFVLALTTAVLILPQLTHYLLDGFIWQKRFSQD